MILVSGSTIARLYGGRTRKWAHEHLRRGSFGPITVAPDGVLFAALSGVEAYAGRSFTAAQLAAAGVPQMEGVIDGTT